MIKINKTSIQYWSAIGMLLSGAGLAVAGFCTSEPLGTISESVLWYVSQTLVYAGSIFGVGYYVDARLRRLGGGGRRGTEEGPTP